MTTEVSGLNMTVGNTTTSNSLGYSYTFEPWPYAYHTTYLYGCTCHDHCHSVEHQMERAELKKIRKQLKKLMKQYDELFAKTHA